MHSHALNACLLQHRCFLSSAQLLNKQQAAHRPGTENENKCILQVLFCPAAIEHDFLSVLGDGSRCWSDLTVGKFGIEPGSNCQQAGGERWAMQLKLWKRLRVQAVARAEARASSSVGPVPAIHDTFQPAHSNLPVHYPGAGQSVPVQVSPVGLPALPC